MSEFDEKLNALLSDPGSMAKIMELAQSLGGPAGGGQAPPPQGPPPAGGGPSPGSSPGNGGFPGGFPSPPDLGSRLGGLDPAMLARLLPLAQELGGAQNSQAAALLFALQPYLKPERQANVPRALQLARLLRLGKRFLRDREGGGLV
mgnify:CR=1 FL=1